MELTRRILPISHRDLRSERFTCAQRSNKKKNGVREKRLSILESIYRTTWVVRRKARIARIMSTPTQSERLLLNNSISTSTKEMIARTTLSTFQPSVPTTAAVVQVEH